MKPHSRGRRSRNWHARAREVISAPSKRMGARRSRKAQGTHRGEAPAIRDAEPVVIVGNEHRKRIWPLAAGIIEIHERGTAIHRAADHARLFKAVPLRRLKHEGPVRIGGRKRRIG
jgi:hypothetical protein